MTTTHRALTFLGTLTAGAMIAAATITIPAHAAADPGDGNSSTTIGTGSPATALSPSDGKGSPSFDVPISIPEVTASNPKKPGDNATQEEKDAYDKAKAEYDRQVSARASASALEYARQQAQKAKAAAQASQHQGDGASVPTKPWCPNNADSCPGNR